MAKKLTPQKIKAIIAARKPGFQVEEQDDFVDQREFAAMTDHSRAQTDAPDLEYLTAKFLGKKTRRQASRDTRTPTSASKIVRVRPAGTRAADAAGTGDRKVVVISAKDEDVIGEQG